MCAKFGCGPTVVSKRGGGGGIDRQGETAALYSRRYSISGSHLKHFVDLLMTSARSNNEKQGKPLFL